MSFPVQDKVTTQAGSSSTTAATFTSNNTVGNILIAAFGSFGGVGAAVSLVADSQGNTWNLVNSLKEPDGNEWIYVYWCSSCKAGANTVTITWSSASTATELIIAEYPALTSPTIEATTTAYSNSAVANITVARSLSRPAIIYAVIAGAIARERQR